MNLSYDSLYQSLAEHNRQAMNSWSYPMFDDLRIDEDEVEDEWEEEEEDEDGEPPRELTPEQREKMNKNLQKIFIEGKERGEEIWNRMNIKNSENLSYDKWLIYNLNKVKSI